MSRWPRTVGHIDKFIPKGIFDDSEDLRRARLTLLFSFALVFQCLFWPFVYGAMGVPQVALCIAVCGGFFAITPVVLQKTQSVRLSAHWLSFVFACCLEMVATGTGGYHSPAGYWLPAVPVTAMLLGGVQSGLIWTSIVIGFTVVNIYVGYFVLEQGPIFDKDAHVLISGLGQAMLSALMFALCLFYERAKNQSLAALDAANGEMRFLLNNVNHGFINTDKNGCIIGHRSKIVETWFGEIARDKDIYIWDLVQRFEPFKAEMMQIAWEQLLEGIVPLGVSLSQLPERVQNNQRQLKFEYQIIFDSKKSIQSVIIMVADISAQVRQEALEEERKESREVIENFTRDREGFTRFFSEANGLVESIQDRESNLYGLLHTLKGNCGIFGVNSVARVCHELEDELKTDGELAESSILRLEDAWSALSDRMTVVLKGFKGKLEVSMHQYLGLMEAIQSGASHTSLFQLVEAWRFEATKASFGRLEQQVYRLARSLNKLPVTVEIEDNDVYLDPERWQPFWSAMIHVIRNAVDHGLEGPERRTELGKPSQAKLRFRSSRFNNLTVIEVSDDGAGVNWDKLRRHAEDRGFGREVFSRDIELLFMDGVSSKVQANEYSGRGVGAGTFRLACRQLGGDVEVLTEEGKGTTLRVTIPDVETFETNSVAI